MALIILIPLIMNDWEGLEHRLKQIYESVKSLPDEESEVPAFQVHEQGRSEENEEEKDPVNVLKAVGEGIFNSDGETWRFQRKTAALEFTTRTLRQAMARRVTRAIGKDPQTLAPGLPENSFATAFDRATEATLQHYILPVGSIRKNFKFDCVYEPRDDQVDVIADALLMVISVLNG